MLGYIVQHFSFLALDVALLRWLVMLSIHLTNVLVNYTLFKKKFLSSSALPLEGRGVEGLGASKKNLRCNYVMFIIYVDGGKRKFRLYHRKCRISSKLNSKSLLVSLPKTVYLQSPFQSLYILRERLQSTESLPKGYSCTILSFHIIINNISRLVRCIDHLSSWMQMIAP